ncbi:hypothetical protein QTP70_035079, partial [Hemibagrus guttatus]
FPAGRVEDDPRVILHFDMDCFYAQVEMIRNPVLRSKPVGVQQKYLMVTCNYVARERGVAKMMSVKEALEKCPDLVLVKGEDLNFYREISYKVTELLMSYCPLVERLGLDENFVDVTELVENRRRNTDVSELSFVGHVYGHDVSSVAVQDHVSLALGSVIASELREVLFSRLSLTSCAGVANSKLLAKLVSGKFKPNQQTTLLPPSVSQLITSLNGVGRVPGIGPRTAERLRALGVFSVRDLQLFPLRQLVCEFGEVNAKRIQSLACGVDLSPVTPAGPPQSLSDEDTFKKISKLSEAESKITELLLSLSERMRKDGRLPQTLKLTLRRSSAPSRWFNRESRQSSIPTHTAHRIINGCPEAVPQLVSIAMKLLQKLVDIREPFHLTMLNMCFTNLQIKASNRNTISSFFTSTHTTTPTPTHTPTQSVCTAPFSFTKPEALCGTVNQNKKESSSSSFFQQRLRSSVPPALERSDPSYMSTPDSIKSLPVPELPPDVDRDVFRALPQHIQSELMSSFRRHTGSAPPMARTDGLITRRSSDAEEPGDVSTAERVPAAPDVPPNVDPYVFSQLPSDVQRELRTEWRRSNLTHKTSPKQTSRRTAVKRSHGGSLLKGVTCGRRGETLYLKTPRSRQLRPLIHLHLYLCRAREERAEFTPISQVVQYEPAHSDAVNCVTSLTSDLCVSGGSDQVVVVYDWRAGKVCRCFHGHSKEITKLGCFAGSTWIFSASRDKSVLMWDFTGGPNPIQSFCGHELVINGVAVSPDGSKLCTGSRDNSMCLWDVESGKCLHRNTISRNLVTHLCWVPGGTSIVQTSEDKTISRTWQVTNTFPAKQYIQTHCDVSVNRYHLLSSSNGFGGHGCEATLWDLRQPGCKVVEYRGHVQTTACCVFLPPSIGSPALVASSSHDSSVKIWDQNTAGMERPPHAADGPGLPAEPTASTADVSVAHGPDDPPELECAVCFSQFDNVFNTPKVLQCGHTFCLECLARINIKSSQPESLQCPLCRAYTPLPSLGLPKLATDSTVLSCLPEAMQHVYSIRFNRNRGRLQVKRVPSSIPASPGNQRRSLDLGAPVSTDTEQDSRRGICPFFRRLLRMPMCRAFSMIACMLIMVSLTIGISILLSNRQ